MDGINKVHTVSTDPETLSQLLDRLQPGLPRTNFIRICVRNIKDGRINAKLYADGWPEFSTLVCQILYPSFSEVAIIVPYSTSKERLVQVLREAELISWGKEQTLCLYVDSKPLAEHLIENLKSPHEGTPGLETSNWSGVHFYLPGELQGPEVSCPDGYVLGKLEPQHTQYITSRWQHSRPERSTLFMNGIIKTCNTVAIFDCQDHINPVAWVIEYPSGEIGHLYTVEEHRQKGQATVVMREMCKKVIARGDLPLCVTTYDNPTYGLLKKLGFLELDYYEEYYVL